MPIYAYKCSACGFAKDTLHKLSDPPHTVCPECGQETFSKQVTAAGFQLKGSGWYVTDFRNNGTAAPPAAAAKPADAGTAATSGNQAAGGAPESGNKSDAAAPASGAAPSGGASASPAQPAPAPKPTSGSASSA